MIETADMFGVLANLKTASDECFDIVVAENDDCCKIVGYHDAKNLTGAVVIPEKIRGLKVTEISVGAFRCNTGITSVQLPSSLRHIEEGSFAKCDNLFHFVSHSRAYRVEADRYLIKNESDVLIAFAQFGVKDVVISDSVKSIGMYVFYGCKSIESVKCSNSLEFIAQDAFSGCTSLREIMMFDNLTVIGSNAFGGCTQLTDVVFSAQLQRISRYAFRGCTGIALLRIPRSVYSIEKDAFSGCMSLKEVCIELEGQFSEQAIKDWGVPSAKLVNLG